MVLAKEVWTFCFNMSKYPLSLDFWISRADIVYVFLKNNCSMIANQNYVANHLP